MAEIHPTAIVDKNAELHESVQVGPFSIIEADVIIDAGTTISSNTVLSSGTRIGKNCRIFNGAVLGTVPQDLKFGDEKTTLEIGDNTTIREFCTLNRGTEHSFKTVVGSNCLFMSYVHVAHDCIIGNNVILANAVNMAGHVQIEDYVGIGGMDPIHQFVRIGRHSFLGGGRRVDRDVPPYILAAGDPMTYEGLNSIGLRRRGFDKDVLMQLKRVYRTIYRSNLNVTQALTKIKEEFELIPEIKVVIEFIESSKRGIIK